VGGAASFWTLVPDLGITRSTGACTLLVYATVICRTVATSRSYPFIGVFVDGVLHATSSAGGDADASDVTMSVVGQIAVGAGSHRIEIRINPGDATVDTRQMLVVEGKR
ncbi:MAG TPA: hypothetical protein VFF65_04060, partial [Phycisphaerales bacterium]|nr:hypothetical protein [Phycisphaerales bacterium]